ncbi:hypothetical protein ACFHYQ_17360 [Sphaerimonospora cavernae]|uniref:LapA family protein n=1 Tax=Sphaerimonospora cavernae TaxID=1740611 RepID=A0ABV6U7X1_9ACTN
MVFLGVLLILVAAAAVIGLWMNGADGAIPITVLDRTFNLTPFETFAAGAATAIVFVIGLALVSAGMRRTTARHRRLREERRSERERLDRLASEKRDLERKLENARAQTAPGPENGPRSASEGATRRGDDHLVAGGSRAGGDPANDPVNDPAADHAFRARR